MSIEEARELLAYHSCRSGNTDDPKWINGFLGSLRPFKGELIENNFIEVMECMRALQDEFNQDKIDKNILSDIVAITYLARVWASPDGMLGSNKLLSEEQTAKLNLWADMIQEALMWLLDGAPEEAFWSYEMYLEGKL
ncbi:MAG: hypothetical protein NC094_02815 [Bacteroidales bacterium]|nr:hypothetical protein [Lachnoclostridium sp.]MCM1383703.1 hypothetical protein [Lachnoclostridium sp.]MCM1464331.1 hypothetical protein [Bacteroidales bacterium]